MFAGLSAAAWILIALSVSLGLVIEVAFLRAQRAGRERQEP